MEWPTACAFSGQCVTLGLVQGHAVAWLRVPTNQLPASMTQAVARAVFQQGSDSLPARPVWPRGEVRSSRVLPRSRDIFPIRCARCGRFSVPAVETRHHRHRSHNVLLHGVLSSGLPYAVCRARSCLFFLRGVALFRADALFCCGSRTTSVFFARMEAGPAAVGERLTQTRRMKAGRLFSLWSMVSCDNALRCNQTSMNHTVGSEPRLFRQAPSTSCGHCRVYLLCIALPRLFCGGNRSRSSQASPLVHPI